MPAEKDTEGREKGDPSISDLKEKNEKDSIMESKGKKKKEFQLLREGEEPKKTVFKKKEESPHTFLQLHLYTILSLAIIIPILVLTVGYLIFPEVVWDRFIWRYYWGPIVADAEDRTIGGISEVYNPVDTLTYAIILVASVIVIYKVLKRFRVIIDGWFTLAVVPFILFGSFARVLEDAGSFEPPIIYLFISPIIYIWVGLMTLGLLMLSVHASRSLEKGREKPGFIIIGSGLATMIVLVSVGRLYRGEDIGYSLPLLFPPLFGALIFGSLYLLCRWTSGLSISTILLGFGLYPMCLGLLALLMVYEELEVLGALAIIGLAVGITFFIWIIARGFHGRFHYLASLLPGINILLIFAHLLDGAATFIGIDFFDYHEKHVLPTFLIETMGTAFVMVPLKMVIICGIIYVLDDLFKDDLKNDRVLVGLVKITILVLGLAPGTRDLVRLGLGV